MPFECICCRFRKDRDRLHVFTMLRTLAAGLQYCSDYRVKEAIKETRFHPVS